MNPSHSSAAPAPAIAVLLLPLMAVVAIAFLIVGMALPVLPLHVHQALGFSTFVVGLVAGSQSAASFVSRFPAGHYADTRGAKRAVAIGLATASAAGLLYVVSLQLDARPVASVATLIAGRAVLGVAESFVITGALSWGLGLVDASSTGKVIAWMGTAMYAGFAAGAPLGTWLYAGHGFTAVAWATVLGPLPAALLIRGLRPVAARHRETAGLARVVRAIAGPGVGLAFGSLGFGATTTFIALLFAARGWDHAWMAFTGFAAAFIAARALFGHLPDRIGGARIALYCIFVEAAGLLSIWLAPGPGVALAGSLLTGFGYSLVYPGFGVEAVRRTPPAQRGLAMGTYTAFLDLALGIAGPALGLVAGAAGLGAVFAVSAVVVLCGAVVAWRLLPAPADR